MIRAIGWTVLLLTVAGGGFYARSLWDPADKAAHDPVRHLPRSSGPTIEQVQKLSKLVSLRVPISDVQVSELQGFTGGLRLVLAAHGDVEFATDLSAAEFQQVDHEQKTALLVLPKPLPTRPRLDHNKTRILELQRNGLWRFVTGQAGEEALTNRAMAYAQEVLSAAAADSDLTAQACHHTQTVVGEFFGVMGWTVTVQWKDATDETART